MEKEKYLNKHIDIITSYGVRMCGVIKEEFSKPKTVMVYGDKGYPYRMCISMKDLEGKI